MKDDIIFVTGCFGAPITETAVSIARETGSRLVSLDEEIEKADGRPVLRICMLMGEHEYRNKEYETLKRLTEEYHKSTGPATQTAESTDGHAGGNGCKTGLVVACGDGVLNDEMSAEIIADYRLVIAGTDMTTDELWENARQTDRAPHAFMHMGDEPSKRQAFDELHGRQTALFDRFLEDHPSALLRQPARDPSMK